MKLLRRVLGSWYDVAAIRVTVELVFIILPIAFLIRTFGFGLYQVPTGSMETTLLVGERFFADKLSYWFRKPQRGEIIAFNDPVHHYSSNPLMNLWQRYASWNVSNWTKRVIGVPGDRIRGVIEDGHPVVYVNDKKLDEKAYLNKYPLLLLWKRLPYEQNRGQGLETDYRSIDFSVPLDKQPFYKVDPHLVVTDPRTLEPLDVREPGTPHSGGKDIFDITLGENQYWAMGDNRLGSSDSREWGILDGKLIHGRIVFRIWSMDTTESWWPIDLIKNPLAFWRKIRWGRCCQPVH